MAPEQSNQILFNKFYLHFNLWYWLDITAAPAAEVVWSDLEVADVTKEEDTGITHQEAGVRNIAQNREKEEWYKEENEPNTDW